MHFPEEELITYLRVFIPQDRVDPLLDEIAAAAIEADVQDPIELYSLAHWLMDADDRRTPEVEAVVLVEEVGLPVDEVAIILDLRRSEVEVAIAQAWDDAAALDRVAAPDPAAPDPAAPDPAVPVQPRPEPIARDASAPGRPGPAGLDAPPDAVADTPAGEDPARVSADAASPEAAVAAAPAAVAPSTPARPTTRQDSRDRGRTRDRGVPWPVVAGAAAVLGFLVLAVAAFSDAGRARLLAQGFQPAALLGLVLGLVVAGLVLLKLAGSGVADDDGSDR